MKRMSRLAVVFTAACVLAVTSPRPLAAIDPPPEEPALARLTTLMDTMHRSMQAMRDDMRVMPHMGPMHERMDRAMGMSDEMRALMRQYSERQHVECSAERPAAPSSERR